MKQKIAIFLVLIIFMASIATGCSLISENEERKSNEVLSTITSDGITLEITRNEYLAYANYMVGQYSQYGSTPDLKTLLPEIMDYMVEQKYLIIKGIVYLRDLPHRKDYMASNLDGISNNTPEGVLTYAERYNAIHEVNEGFRKEIDRYVDEYEQEKKNRDISQAKEELDVLYKSGYTVDKVEIASGSFKEEYQKDEKFDSNNVRLIVTVSKGEDSKSVSMPVNESMYDEDAKFSTELSSEEQSEKVVNKQVILIYEEPIIVDNETEYKVHQTDAFDYRVVVPRGTEKEDETIDVRVGKIIDRYKSLEEIKAENKEKYFDYNISTTPALKEAYRQFRQTKKDMLINFDTDGLNYYYKNQYESAVLEALKHEIANAPETKEKISKLTDRVLDEEYRVLVEKQKEKYDLLTTDKDKLNKFVSSLANGSVNLEEVYYVPTEAIENEGYDLREFFAIAHILFKFDDEQTQFIDSEKGDREADELKELRWEVAQQTITSRSNPDYDPDYEGDCAEYEGQGICPKLAFDPDHLKEYLFQGDENIYDAISSSLQEQETPEDRLRKFKDYMALYNDDGGAIQSHTGYLITPKGIPHSYDGNDFPELAWSLFEKNPEVGSAFIDGEEEDILGYSFTSYGLHLMMISFIPFEEGAVLEDGSFSIDAPIDSKGTTHRERIIQKLAQEIRDDEYTDFVKEKKPKDKDYNLNKKKFKKLLKELGIK